MARRKLTDAQVRDLVRARITKGDAYRIVDQAEYEARQAAVREELAKMTREQVIARWPHHCYDF